ncbi:unnamed protein product [Phyllotreta striolata]|uniref:CLIP domain-containing serine protease n=1 Tax=Phyllotreta striolata TaxID=444603 RepID=A0A9N9TQH3_PHYSR|nr:unnamed protein product [Phyllotreta striolata]
MNHFRRAILFVGCLILTVKCDNDCTTPNSESGSCVELKDCPLMLKVFRSLQNPVPQIIRDQLNKYVCSKNPTILFCCPKNSLNSVTPSPSHHENIIYDNHQKCKTPDGVDGSCVSLSSCKTIFEIARSLRKPKSPKVVEHMHKYVCAAENGEEKVCCPDGPIIIHDDGSISSLSSISSISSISSTSFNSPISSRSGPVDLSRHRNVGLLPDQCGYVDIISGRIRNGLEAELNEFPWMALLGYKSDKGTLYRCGGTILNDRYILTAAHCIMYNPYIVRVGEYNISSETDCTSIGNLIFKCNLPVQDVAIEQSIVHPQYSSSSYENDIALIRVQKMNIHLEHIRPICLPLGTFKTSKSEKFIVTGWGVVVVGTGRGSEVLKKAEIKKVDNLTCKNRYSGLRATITEKQICALGMNNQDSCKGDSGGPIQQMTDVYNNTARYIQHGIVSFGIVGCGIDGMPGVYTNVSSYMEWILDTLKP